MRIPEELFHIELTHLKEDKIFPFHLYVYNPQSNSYSAYLFANAPFTEDKRDFAEFIEDKGGSLAIDKKQKRTFLQALGHKEEDIPSLQARELSELEKKRLEKLKAIHESYISDDGEELVKPPAYDLKDGLSSCIKEDNFLPMIIAARNEIEVFEVNISHTVSLAAYLAENLLTEDNFTNRIVAVSYFMTKNMDMKDQETLADIICAGFFCHLGYTQLDYSISHTPELELTEKDQRKLRKHPGYSHHLLVKSGVEISDRCKHIIFQHHERYDGSGYPSQKHSDFIDILALTLGAITHIFEFSEGRINGGRLPLGSVINRLKNKTFTSGLEFEFGDKIYENLINLVSNTTENKIEEAA